MRNEKSTSETLNIFWLRDLKSIPPRPDNPYSYPEDDIRHWYDQEYAGFFTDKVNVPDSPAVLGAKGKHVVCIHPGNHPYLENFSQGISQIAEDNKIKVTFFTTSWDMQRQAESVTEAIALNPDLIIMVPENINNCVDHYKQVNDAGIPVICSNSLPEPDVYKYVIAWTGPDDWGQYRNLAHHFAELMGKKGEYCIIRHIPGTSSYLTRTWGFIAELKRIAPEIQLLEAQSTYLEPHMTEMMVENWILHYGERLKGIVSSGEHPIQLPINNVLRRHNREDIIRVSVGSTSEDLDMVEQGSLHAIAYQNGLMDGALAMQTAVDWFSGLKVEPVRYLPRFIVNKGNVKDFIEKKDTLPKLDSDSLYDAMKQLNTEAVELFFHTTIHTLQSVRFIKEEFLRGYIIQIFSVIIQMLKLYGLELEDYFSSNDEVYKRLFGQSSLEAAFTWLNKASVDIVEFLKNQNNTKTLIALIIDDINTNFSEPVSLKTLAAKYEISASYLGQLFRKETGKNFTDYLNLLRIERAKTLLASTELKEKSISLEIGYSDHNYFYRVFKKYEGVSPSTYRKDAR